MDERKTFVSGASDIFKRLLGNASKINIGYSEFLDKLVEMKIVSGRDQAKDFSADFILRYDLNRRSLSDQILLGTPCVRSSRRGSFLDKLAGRRWNYIIWVEGSVYEERKLIIEEVLLNTRTLSCDPFDL